MRGQLTPPVLKDVFRYGLINFTIIIPKQSKIETIISDSMLYMINKCLSANMLRSTYIGPDEQMHCGFYHVLSLSVGLYIQIVGLHTKCTIQSLCTDALSCSLYY